MGRSVVGNQCGILVFFRDQQGSFCLFVMCAPFIRLCGGSRHFFSSDACKFGWLLGANVPETIAIAMFIALCWIVIVAGAIATKKVVLTMFGIFSAKSHKVIIDSGQHGRWWDFHSTGATEFLGC